MGGQWQITYHALIVAWYILVDLYMVAVIIRILLQRWDILMGQFGIGLQYFTVWNLVAQQGYFVLSLQSDLIPQYFSKFKKYMECFLTTAFHGIIFPLGVLVAADFWVLYKIDPKLIDQFDALGGILYYANQVTHTAIMPIVMLELLIAERPRKYMNNWLVFAHLIALHLVYVFVVFGLHLISNIWPYPMLNRLSYCHMILIAIANSVVGTGFSYLGMLVKAQVRNYYDY